MGLSGISKSTVSKLCKDIDERVGEFLNRPLTGDWPYVWLDATYLKQRQGGRIVSVAAIIAVAANTEGRREIIGLGVGPSEAETFWMDFLRSLKARGLDGVKLVISDAHTGLKGAISRVFEATWQRCRVHWMRNALAHVSRGQHTVVAAAIRQAFEQPDRKHAGETWQRVADQLRPRWPKLADLMDASEHDVLAYMAFPRQHRTKLHSTNPIERLNKEVKRRADVVGIFPNEASIMRLIGAVLFEQNDEWQTSSRYMMVEAFAQIDEEEIDPILSITTKGLIMPSGHLGNYTTLTDATILGMGEGSGREERQGFSPPDVAGDARLSRPCRAERLAGTALPRVVAADPAWQATRHDCRCLGRRTGRADAVASRL
jgi:transposase-like protein